MKDETNNININQNLEEMQIKSEDEKIDIKATMSSLFKTEEIQLSQEDAIKNYTEKSVINNKKTGSSDASDDETAYNEELEHLNRIKKELLASLARVKKLEEKIFGENKKAKKIEEIKIKNSNVTNGETKKIEKENKLNENIKNKNEDSEKTR